MRIPASCVLGVVLVSTGPGASAQQAGPAAPIIIQVSDCKLADKPLETKPAKEVLSQVVGDELEAISPVGDAAWVSQDKTIPHPFLAAAHFAFAEHRPLALSPDMIWQLLIQQAAEEVHAKPEAYRELFATHEYGKRQLSIRRDEFQPGNPNNDWLGVFAELESQIIKAVPDSPARFFSHAFSTSTATDIAVRRITCLDGASDFYDYYMSTWCGIPRIELHGTAEDWEWLRTHARQLKVFNMGRRIQALRPVLDEFVAAANGKATPEFWKSYYKYSSESGSSYASGWINLFFIDENNKLLDVVLKPEFSWAAAKAERSRLGASNLPLALRIQSYKSNGLTEVELAWNCLGDIQLMRIQGGFLGVEQMPQSMTLKPATAWRILRAKLSPEETAAVKYLASIKRLDEWGPSGFEHIHYDPGKNLITISKELSSCDFDVRFWIKAFPLMQNLREIDAAHLLSNVMGHDSDQWLHEGGSMEKLEALGQTQQANQRAACTAMLSAPNVKIVHVWEDMNAEYLKILQSRKDWEVRPIKAVKVEQKENE